MFLGIFLLPILDIKNLFFLKLVYFSPAIYLAIIKYNICNSFVSF